MDLSEKLKHRIPANFAASTDLALIAIDAVGTIEFVNPSALQLFGFEADEMVGNSISIIIPERMRGAHDRGLARVAQGHKPNLGGKTVEVTACRKDGSEVPIELTLSVWTDDGEIHAGAVIKDISQRRERETKLLRLASHDTLTGLPNRHRFTELLDEQLAKRQHPAVMLLDLETLKEVNDLHGHMVGDSLLQAVAVRLRYVLPGATVISRSGGDQFAIMMPGISGQEEAFKTADVVLQALASPFAIGGYVFDGGATAGLALSPLHGTTGHELLASADYALFKAKSTGKRSCRIYDSSMRTEISAMRALRGELLAALRRDELQLYYQPQIDLVTNAVCGVEALIRWSHSDRGLLLPGAFLPALDGSVLALEIGWWTLDKACAQAARLRDLGRPIKMGVNLFQAQVRADSLRVKVMEALDRYQLDPALLELEVTESVALTDDDRILDALSQIRALGVGLAFDDFGTGYASLSSLQRYPLTTLKIDRSFVKDMRSRPGDRAITNALISMSRDLGLKTIAEGIESRDQAEALKSLGCPIGQGYWFGKPMPAEMIEKAVLCKEATFS